MGQVKTTITVVDKASAKLNKIYASINKVQQGFQRLNSASSGVRNVSNEVKNLGTQASKSSKQVSLLSSKLRRLASTYLGVLGAKAMFETADTMTSANNKFTTLARQSYGMNDEQATAFSADAMEKIFNSAQSAATSYTDMMTNVAKSVTLAGDAFGETSDQQINNAIKFQEIMAKSYALGGASMAEQSSSMYQLVQALGSGNLQGDELRSVREGAPLAYQAIEQFAQGVLKSTKSLKELGSEGLITSDMVVAAILDMEGKTNEAFSKIDLTWSQLWTKFKNEIVYAFKPFGEALRQIANSDGFQLIIGKIADMIGKVMQLFSVIGNGVAQVFDWIGAHWSYIEPIVNALVAALLVLGGVAIGRLIAKTAILIGQQLKLAASFLLTHSWALILAAVVGVLVFIFSALGYSIETVSLALLILGTIAMVVGIVINAPWLILIGLILIAASIVLLFADTVFGVAAAIAAVVVNVALTIATIAVSVFWTIVTAVQNLWITIKTVVQAIGAFFGAVFNNIKVAVCNHFLEMAARGYDFAAKVCNALAIVADYANKVLGIFGIEIDTSGLKGAVDKYASQAQALRDAKGEYESPTDAFSEVWSNKQYIDLEDRISSNIAPITDKFVDVGEWYNAGSQAGSNFQDWVANLPNTIGGKLSEMIGGSGSYDPTNVANADLSGLTPEDLANKLGDIGDDAAGTKKNTDDIAKNTALSEEDLSYLRRVAELEWKKEFTTANIQVSMTNNNKVEGESDLDGIVTKLKEKLEEELEAVAEGVYA